MNTYKIGRLFVMKKNKEGKPSDFIKCTKTNSCTGQSDPTSLPTIGNAFMYIESSGNNNNFSNDNVFVSFKGTVIILISNITFYHKKFSTSMPEKRNLGNLEIQLLRNGSWETELTTEKDTNFSALSTDWT